MLSFLTFIQLQLDRIRGVPQPHAPGPKKPSLTQTDLGIKK
jgi:hypothetical protein